MNGLQSAFYRHACTGRLATMFAAIGTVLALTLGFANASDMRWSYYRDLNEDPFQTRLTLVYGIPETDATQFVAQCHIGNRGTYATIDISAEIGSLGENEAVKTAYAGRAHAAFLNRSFSEPGQLRSGIFGLLNPDSNRTAPLHKRFTPRPAS